MCLKCSTFFKLCVMGYVFHVLSVFDVFDGMPEFNVCAVFRVFNALAVFMVCGCV